MEKDLLMGIIKDIDDLIHIINCNLDSGTYKKELDKVYASLRHINMNLDVDAVIKFLCDHEDSFEYSSVIHTLLLDPTFNPKMFH